MIEKAWFQEISIPTPRKVIGNSEAEGVSKAKILKGKYDANLEILRGSSVPTKIPSVGEGMDIIRNHTI